MIGDTIVENQETTAEDIATGLSEISESTWKDAGWPVVAIVSRKALADYDERNPQSQEIFWNSVFDQERFVTPQNVVAIDPQKSFLFMLHSFKDTHGNDTVFKAITTNPKDFADDPTNSIYYSHHGGPCEARGGGSYPTRNFWDFYDRLPSDKKDKYAIPDTNWRKHFIQTKILEKN